MNTHFLLTEQLFKTTIKKKKTDIAVSPQSNVIQYNNNIEYTYAVISFVQRVTCAYYVHCAHAHFRSTHDIIILFIGVQCYGVSVETAVDILLGYCIRHVVQ